MEDILVERKETYSGLHLIVQRDSTRMEGKLSMR